MKCSARTTPHWIYLGIEQGRKCPGSGVWEKHRLLSIIFIIAPSYLQSIKCLALCSVLREYYLVQSLWNIMSTTPHISYKQPHTLSTAKLSAFTQRKIPQKTNSNLGLSDSGTLLSLSLLWSSLGSPWDCLVQCWCDTQWITPLLGDICVPSHQHRPALYGSASLHIPCALSWEWTGWGLLHVHPFPESWNKANTWTKLRQMVSFPLKFSLPRWGRFTRLSPKSKVQVSIAHVYKNWHIIGIVWGVSTEKLLTLRSHTRKAHRKINKQLKNCTVNHSDGEPGLWKQTWIWNLVVSLLSTGLKQIIFLHL